MASRRVAGGAGGHGQRGEVGFRRHGFFERAFRAPVQRLLGQGQRQRGLVPQPRRDLPGNLLVLARRGEVVAAVQSAGFRFVALDLEGFTSGSMNRMVGVAAPAGGTEENA